MASFDAGSVIDPLDYDFSVLADKYGIKEFAGVKGTVREPTDDQIMKFGQAMITHEQRRRLMDPRADMTEDATVDQYLEGAAKYAENVQAAGLNRAEAEIFSALCSGKPTAAQLMKMPPRVRQGFYKWLRDEVLSPEAAAGDGNAEVVTLPTRVAG